MGADPTSRAHRSGLGGSPLAGAGERGPSFREYWWIPALAGGLSLVAGIIVLAEPKGSLETIALILGIYLVVLACTGLFNAMLNPGRTGGHRMLVLVLALLALIAGIIVIIRPDATVKGVALAFGIYLILSGLRYLVLALLVPVNRAIPAVHGALELAGGVIVVVWPHIALVTLAVVLGVYLILSGLLQLWAGFALRRASPAS